MMKLIVFLTSRSFAVFLLCLSIGILIIWNRFPKVYSHVFLIVPACLFLSISFCIVKRIIAHNVIMDTRFWGSFTFHIGLLVIIAAPSLGFLTRFWATVILPQGMTVSMEDRTFAFINNIPVWRTSPDILIKMDGYEASYADNSFPIDYATHITLLVKDKDIYRQKDADIKVNAPLWWGGYQFLLEEGIFSPLFIMRDRNGNEIYKQYLRVSSKTEIEDKIEIPKADLVLYLRFFPDIYKQGNKYGSRSPYPRNPAFGLKVTGKDNPFNDIWKGVLKKGEKAEFEGTILEFADLKQVVILQVIKDPTYYGILVGWLLIICGLILRYLPFRRYYKRYVESETF